VRVCATNEPHWPNVTRVRDRCAAHRKNVMINLLVGRPCTAPRTRLSLMQSAGGTCGSMLTTGQVGACRWIASLCGTPPPFAHPTGSPMTAPCPCRLAAAVQVPCPADSTNTPAGRQMLTAARLALRTLRMCGALAVASFAVVGFCTHTRRHRHRPKQA
jgi:hypothetical protein